MNAPSPEFQLIKYCFEIQAAAHQPHSVIVGIGDDCAVLAPSTNQQVISVDTSIADVHFPSDADAFSIAYRALTVALSDLAAMGAEPTWFTLAISLNQHDKHWLEQFSQGLFHAAKQNTIALIGGDTTKVPASAPLSITVQVHGEVPPGQALLRANARVGQHIYVTNTLGDAAAGLACYQQRLRCADDNAQQWLLQRYLQPQPQLKSGTSLRGKASACIDISDGLLADLSHILRASSAKSGSPMGARISLDKIPLSAALRDNIETHQALTYALSGGDDYQLCFTSSLTVEELGLENITNIGSITASTGIEYIQAPEGVELNNLSQQGFDHFL